jgi:hypothetical protein
MHIRLGKALLNTEQLLENTNEAKGHFRRGDFNILESQNAFFYGVEGAQGMIVVEKAKCLYVGKIFSPF